MIKRIFNYDRISKRLDKVNLMLARITIFVGLIYAMNFFLK